ncbi:MAG: hypothetical protein H7122_16220 [Chitinophagaceae bacterium]|nr:hypothetical protein [Chitinophagaceae bacterium]
MDLDGFDDYDHIPEFDRNRFSGRDEGEEWKHNHIDECSRNLYNKAKEIYKLTRSLTDLFPEAEQAEYIKSVLIGNASIIPAKIIGAQRGFYSMQMEKAVIVKMNIVELRNTLWMCLAENWCDESYVEMVRAEIEQFRLLFIDWIKSFDKTNDFADEWHLFNDPETFPKDDEE